jgi:hypothetical protein
LTKHEKVTNENVSWLSLYVLGLWMNAKARTTATAVVRLCCYAAAAGTVTDNVASVIVTADADADAAATCNLDTRVYVQGSVCSSLFKQLLAKLRSEALPEVHDDA